MTTQLKMDKTIDIWWPVNTREGAQHHWSSGKCKLSRYIPFGTKVKKTGHLKCWWGEHCWWKREVAPSHCRTVMKLNPHLPSIQWFSPLVGIPKRNENKWPHKDLDPNAYRCFILNNPNLETTQVSLKQSSGHTMDCYWGIKRNKLLMFTTMVNSKIILLRGGSQTPNSINVIPYMLQSRKDKWNPEWCGGGKGQLSAKRHKGNDFGMMDRFCIF